MAAKNRNKYLPWIALIVLGLFYTFTSIAKVMAPQTTELPPTAVVAGATTEVVTETTSINDANFPVYFTSPVRPYNGQKIGGIEDNLIKMIDGAKKSVHLAVFEFDLEDVAQALIRAKARGVEVRVVHDDEHTAPDPQIGELEKAGITAVPDKRSAYMHDKFFVIDSYCVWTGSFNLSVNAAFKNNENAVMICDSGLADNYETEFFEMFNGSFGPKSPANTPHPELLVNGVMIENYFAPEDEVMPKVISTVAMSKVSVHFMAFSFTDDNLANSMIDLMGRGVEVSGIFESKGANTDSSTCTSLLAHKAKIGLDGNPYTFHHKVIIIDGQIVIFGSFNFTANANEQNDENLLIVHSPALAQKFEQEFQSRWAESKPPVNGECVSK